jgi:hypothetical protein
MKKACGFRFQGHYVYRQYFEEHGRYKIMVWVASNPPEEELCADVAFCGDSHNECMDKLKQWLEINNDWVNKTDA